MKEINLNADWLFCLGGEWDEEKAQKVCLPHSVELTPEVSSGCRCSGYWYNSTRNVVLLYQLFSFTGRLLVKSWSRFLRKTSANFALHCFYPFPLSGTDTNAYPKTHAGAHSV